MLPSCVVLASYGTVVPKHTPTSKYLIWYLSVSEATALGSLTIGNRLTLLFLESLCIDLSACSCMLAGTDHELDPGLMQSGLGIVLMTNTYVS